MTDNDPDYAVQASVLERDLRALKRSIVAVVQRGQAALDDENKDSLFEAHLSTASDDWQEFRNAWNQFTSLQLRLGKRDFPDQQWQAFYDQTRDELVKGKSILLNIQRRKNVSAPVPQDISFQNATLSSNSRSNLPKIQLPHFSGDLIKWTHFKDTFKSMVHEDPNLSNIERFHYLLGALRGEASSLLSGIPVDGNSYPLAWNKLMKEYDRPRILASLFLQRMVDFDIRKFKNEAEQYDSYIAHIADSVDGFKALKLENPGEFILAFLALRGLDSSSRKEFEIALDSPDIIPTPEDVIEFVRKRRSAHKFSNDFSSKSSHCETETPFSRKDTPNRFSFKYSRPKGHQFKSSDLREPHNSKTYYTLPKDEGSPQVQTKVPCPLCQGQHLLSYCIKFEGLPIEERLSFTEGWKGCRNCLRGTHITSKCTSKWRCRFCKQNHHRMLHTEEGTHHAKVSPKPSAQKQKPSTKPDNVFTGFGATPSSSAPHKIALLGTIQGVIKGPRKGLFPFRAVLDSGSQRTFMSQPLARKIGVQIRQGAGFITGLGGITVSNPTGSVRCVLRPFKEDIEFTTEALVVESISAPLPSSPIDEEMVTNLLNLHLADPTFHQPGPIDILIGMDLYPSIMNGPIYHSKIEDLYLQPTSFGLVVIGSHSAGTEPHDTALFNDTRYTIQERLKKFWELEEPTAVERVSPEDKYCEEHFIQTHSRNSEGRYIVKLPRNTGCEYVGNNVDVVTKRFLGLEKRLGNDHEMAKKYKQFMQEYLDLKHMTLATTKSNYLIPHHSVWQHKPGGKKLRVVFDASCPSSTRS